jgi:LmbE family N-acetylglucosaminyl deacetylase
MMRYARDGADVYVATATRGEMGSLGTGGLVIDRDKLPEVREAEMRSVLEVIGARPPIFLGYRDAEVANADFEELVERVMALMSEVEPDVVITWGPSGISGHEDHIAVHKAAVESFIRYRASRAGVPRLFYVAISREDADRFELDPDESETSLTVVIDIEPYAKDKLRALRMYRSQEDAQQIADMFEEHGMLKESFRQALPPATGARVASGFWV